MKGFGTCCLSKWPLWLLLLLCVPMLCLGSESSDNQLADSVETKGRNMATLLNWPIIGVPTIGYSPETSWQFGLAASWFFQCDSLARTSELSVQARYTLENQVAAHAQTTLYFDPEKRWMMQAALGYTYYPNIFFGIGNERKDLLQMPWHYISNIFYLSAQPQYYLTRHWTIGPTLDRKSVV